MVSEDSKLAAQDDAQDEPETRQVAVSKSLEPGNVLTSPITEGRAAFFQGDFDAAVTNFDRVLADSKNSDETRAKAAYWRAEALLQKEFTSDKIALFEEVAQTYDHLYIGSAARRRAIALRAHFAVFEESDTQ